MKKKYIILITSSMALSSCLLGGCKKSDVATSSQIQENAAGSIQMESSEKQEATESLEITPTQEPSNESVSKADNSLDKGNVNENTNSKDNSSSEPEPYHVEDDLKEAEDSATLLENSLQNENLTQMEMTQTSAELYQLWDDLLNTIWSHLNDTLDSDAMEKLRVEEREWVKNKEQEIKEAGSGCEGGSIQPMIENDKAAELTKKRVYELADYLR